VPVHFDPYELCGDRADHAHVRRLTISGESGASASSALVIVGKGA